MKRPSEAEECTPCCLCNISFNSSASWVQYQRNQPNRLVLLHGLCERKRYQYRFNKSPSRNGMHAPSSLSEISSHFLLLRAAGEMLSVAEPILTRGVHPTQARPSFTHVVLVLVSCCVCCVSLLLFCVVLCFDDRGALALCCANCVLCCVAVSRCVPWRRE